MKKIILFIAIYSIFFNAISQSIINGHVENEYGEPLFGANVRIDKTYLGTSTDVNGSFIFKNIKNGKITFIISYLGYNTLKQEVTVDGDESIKFILETSYILGDEVIVSAIKAKRDQPLAFTDINREEIEKADLGQDIPYIIGMTPSLVATSDAGAGVGYTNFRIRGTDANRINVTVNGIPLNDSESHGVWWVNMPDFAGSIDNIQVQRGVGTSTNGAGAFGGTINMQTNTLKKDAYAEVASSAGSFATLKNTIRVGTGLLNDHFTFDMRISKISSDGFIDRAFSDLKSFFTSTTYYSEKTIIKLNIFSGKERTYQAWNGVPKVRLDNDFEGMQRYGDHWLYTQEETIHMINSNSRTYNYYTYDDETDNYQQDHYQAFFSHKLSENLNMNAALHYTYGRGYYEQYRVDDDLSDYQLSDIIIGANTITSTDLIRQKWLDNDFYGATFSVDYKNPEYSVILGGALNQYDGRHFGKVIWGQFLGDANNQHEWYRSTGLKTDYNIYGKAEYNYTSNVKLFMDLQYRYIDYRIDGIDDDLRNISQIHTFRFFNPKAGIFGRLGENIETYFFYAIGHREPTRSNYTDAAIGEPKPTFEKLNDYELGGTYRTSRISLGMNLYFMDYEDQLILTGQINDVGNPIMTNVDESYRAGMEIIASLRIIKDLIWNVNTTFSKNKIKNFIEYVDNWDIWGQQNSYDLGETDIAFSPNFLVSNQFEYTYKKFQMSLMSQYVGKQFIDNTSSNDRMLDAYFVNNMRFNYSLTSKLVEKIQFSFLINNILNEKYESNAWVYPYLLGGERYAMDGYFPQAGTNFLVGINVKL